jgi:outer membrane immunogenic protein
MLRSMISVSALALLSSWALAADLPVFQPGPAMTSPVPMASNWTGFYVGVQGGFAFGGSGSEVRFDADGDGVFDDGDFSGDDRNGFTIGAKVGYDVQINRFVVGAVADINYLDFDSDIDFDDDTAGSLASISMTDAIDWYATLRGRAGFLVTDSVLAYAHAGIAYASTDDDGSFIDINGDEGDFGDNGNDWGWTIGAGVEAAVTDHIRVGLEYSYLNFGDSDDDLDSADFEIDRADSDFHTVRASVSYKF